MATSTPSSTSAPSAGSTRGTLGRPRRTPRVIVASDPALAQRGRRTLLTATVLVAVGSFLPWVHTALGNVPGYAGGGLWTFYFSMLGFAAMLVTRLRLAAVQAVVMGLVAVALPTWQLVRLASMVGFSGWLPGFGLLMVLGGGVLALIAARRLIAAA